MSKNHLDKDFFLSEEGRDLFELKASEKVRHRCVTDEANKIRKIYESHSQGGAEGLMGTERLTELVVGLGDHVPLWVRGVTLKWRLHPLFNNYTNAENVKNYIRGILGEAILKWGSASPVSFQETTGKADFEIMMRPDSCNAYGCTLASAFFPNSNFNILSLYPKMFQQDRFEQVETMVHELGHIFGLRHYFAKESETSWRSEIFGHHHPLTIMNYGHNSTLTEQDKTDLETLYSLVWGGRLRNINGLPIRLYKASTQP
jgi:hypothetical protein